MSGVMQATFWWQYASPSTLPALQVWYDASDGKSFNKSSSAQANNTAVTSWQNAGGLTSHDLNSTGGHRPTFITPGKNNLGVVRFSPAATSELTINPISYMQGLSAVTMAIVFKSSNTASGTRVVTSTNSNGFRWGQNGTQWIGGFAGATFTVDTVTADTNWHHIILKFDGSKSNNSTKLNARLDSSDLTLTYTGTVANFTSNTASTFYAGFDANNNYFHGDIGEILFWTSALNPGQIAAVENYITTKWNI
jgi:hypothetical protein